MVAVAAYAAFGMAGIGRPSAAGIDLDFLVVAGETWNAGRDAYLAAARAATVDGQRALEVYAFAYPPWAHPLAALFGAVRMPLAIHLSFVLNALAWSFVVITCLKMAQEGGSLPQRPSVARQMAVAALVVVMPFAAHVSWMGQTSLLCLAATIAAWRCAEHGKPVLAGLCLAIAAIKPQILLLPWLAMLALLPRRSSLWATAFGLAACIYPTIQAGGPSALMAGWLEQAAAYRASPLNSPGFQHQTGMESLLAALGLRVHGGWFVAVAAGTILALCLRWRMRAAEALSVASCLAVLLLPLHDYDLVFLAVPIVTLGVTLSRPVPLLFLGATVVLLYLPQRVLRGDVPAALLHYRTLLPAILLALLVHRIVRHAPPAAARVGGARLQAGAQ